MKKTLGLMFCVIALTLSACVTPRITETPTVEFPTDESVLSTETPVISETETPIMSETETPTMTDETPAPTDTGEPATAGEAQYTNDEFKFGFRYPSNWFGPDEYVSDNTLRLAVGSDVVYPYGEVPETPSTVLNSYLVIIQYTKVNQNAETSQTFETLASLADGESKSDARTTTTRVRALQLGRFTGYEYTTTLSETAQTERFYMREVLLVDEANKDTIWISGQPNNVEVTDPATWRDVYIGIDQENLAIFEAIVDSVTVE